MIASKVLNVILTEIRIAKYYSISVDSTPDISHVDQLVFCMRYVKANGPIERFIQFIPINQHKSNYLTDTVVDFLDEHNIDIRNCRGQSYDNTNNMAGKYSGLQARILAFVSLALFFPCAAHSLNLVGYAAVSKTPKAAQFFCFLEKLYLFFVKSTSRWDLLKSSLSTNMRVLKRSSGTRWSAKFEAVNSLNGNIVHVKGILAKLIDDDELQQSDESKAIAKGILRDLCKFENILMLKIWYAILRKFNMVQTMLQSPDLNLSVTVTLYKSLVDHVEVLKSDFDHFFDEAKSIYTDLDADEHAQVYRGAITLNNMDDRKEHCRDTLFMPVLNLLNDNLKSRMQSYVDVANKFSFLVALNNMTLDEIRSSCHNVASFYKDDIDENELMSECEFARNFFFAGPPGSVSHASMYSQIIEDKLQNIFPNIEILLRIFLSFFVTNVAGERSFSKMKNIKTALRNRLSEDKLNAFALFSIDHDVLNTLNFDEIINEFVLIKNRKDNISIKT